MAEHTYRLVHHPQHFPDTYVLVTHQGESYAVRDYSEGRVETCGPERFGRMSVGELLGSIRDKRCADPDRADDVAHWSLLVGRTNRRIGREDHLDPR